MKILFITQDFPHKNRPDACAFIKEQALALSKLAEVIVIAPVYRFFPIKKYAFQKKLLKDIPFEEVTGKLTVYRPRYMYYPWLFRFFNIFSFISAVKKIIKKEKISGVEIIHSHFAHAGGYCGALLKRALNAPLVITVHGSDINRFILEETAGVYVKKRALKALDNADAIIAVSKDLENKVKSTGNYQSKIHSIYNGVALDKFKPSDKTLLRKGLGLPLHQKVLLYVGNIIENKGIFDIIDALSILMRWRDDIIAVFIGNDGTNGFFLDKITSLPHVTYLGVMDNDNVAKYMQAVDLLVHPSYSEGFGMVIVESLACGCPVVTTNVGAIPEIISSRKYGILTNAGNPSALAEAIEDALQIKWDQNELINQAKRFSMSSHIDKLLSLYNDLMYKP